MTIKRREGRPTEAALRWNLVQASRETGIHREQLERRRRALGIEPDPSGYTTKEIMALVFGDKEAEVIGKIAAERKKVELDNAKSMGELVPVDAVVRFCEGVGVVFRQAILTSSMTEQEREDALSNVVKLFDAGTVTNQIIAGAR